MNKLEDCITNALHNLANAGAYVQTGSPIARQLDTLTKRLEQIDCDCTNRYHKRKRSGITGNRQPTDSEIVSRLTRKSSADDS